MFDLEQSIAEWRKHMRTAGIKSPAVLDELEGHLREEIERQIKSDIQAQTAFSKAIGKMGEAKALGGQFKGAQEIDKAKQRTFIGYFYSGLLIVYVLAATDAMAKNGLSVSEWWLGMTAQLTLVFLSWFCWRQMSVHFPMIRGRRLQSVVGLAGGISGAVWFLAFAYFILPHCNFTTGELVVALLWAMVPTLVLPEAAFLLLGKGETEELQVS